MNEDLQIAGSSDDFRVNISDEDITVSMYGDDYEILLDKSPVAVNGKDGAGVASGGAAGEVLMKKSSVDFDTQWGTIQIGVPSDGAPGQFLMKLSALPLETVWADLPPGVPAGGEAGMVLAKATNDDYDITWVPNLNPSAFVAKAGDTMIGPLVLAGNPTTPLQAAPKQYVDLRAPLNSPVFTGNPQVPNPPPGDNDASIASTQFVQQTVGLYLPLAGGTLSNYLTLHSDPISSLHAATRQYVDNVALGKAPLNSPVFTGDPQAPTPTAGDNDTSIATTAFVTSAVNTAVGLYLPLAGGSLSGALTVAAGGLSVLGGTGVLIDSTGSGVFALLAIKASPGTSSYIDFQSTSRRWRIGKNSAAESGANAGSNFIFEAFDDAAVSLGQVYTVARATRIVDFKVSPTVPTVTPATDSTTKAASTAFVQAAIVAAGTAGGIYMPLAGGTMTGPLTLAADPAASLEAATKQYVDLRAPLANPVFTGDPQAPTPAAGDNDTSIATTAFVQAALGLYLPLTGGTLTGALNITAGGLNVTGGNVFIDHTGVGTDSDVFLIADNQASALFRMRTGAIDRWRVGKDDAIEAGGNSGSDFIIKAYNDAGTSNFSVLNIPRATQVAAFAKTPTAPTALSTANDTQLATTAWVNTKAGNYLPLTGGALTNFLTLHADPTNALHAATMGYVDTKAPLISPAFTGNPTAPTPTAGDNDTSIATTAFVASAINTAVGLYLPLTGGTLSGALTITSGLFSVNGGDISVDRRGDVTTAAMNIHSDAAQLALILFKTGAATRWHIGKDAAAESGGLTGSNFTIGLYNDAGSALANALTINRLSRVVNFPVSPTSVTPSAGDNTTSLATTAFVTAADNLKANKAGDTFTGTVNITTASETNFTVNAGSSGFGGFILFRTGATSTRWRIGKHVFAESGSDVGSDFYFTSYTDAGVVKAHVLTIKRSDGVATFLASPVAPTPTAGDSSTKLATTAFVANAIAGATTGGVPAGGAANQVLAKVSATNYDMAWVDPAGAGTFLALSGGTMTGKLILDPADQTDPNDAATRSYAASLITGLATLADPAFTGNPTAPTAAKADNDTSIATTAHVKLVVADYLPLTGGALTGALTLAADPSVNLHPVTLQYLNAQLALKASLASATFTGEVIVPTPTFASHAANKGYVDGQLTAKAPLNNPTFTGSVIVPTPTAGTQAANKDYVDGAVTGLATLADPVFTGNPRLTTHPVAGDADTSLASTKWVDDYFLKLSGGVLTGTLTLPSANPTLDDHAARKVYVDQQVATRATPAYVDAGLALKANLTGANFTGSVSTTGGFTATGGNIITTGGNIQVTRTSTTAEMYLTSDASIGAFLMYRSGANMRWRLGKNQSPAESGSDTGGVFGLLGYQDNATPFTVFTVQRDGTARGVVNFGFIPKAPTATPGDNSTQLATTAFVLAAVAGGGSFLPVTGGTLTGDLTMSGAGTDLILAHNPPAGSMQAATALYVDTAVDLKSNLTGGNTFSGAQVFNNSVEAITELILPASGTGYPSADRHAVPRYYVTAQLAPYTLKTYVDAQDALKANLSGATFTGNLATNGGSFTIDRFGDSAPAELFMSSNANQIEHITFRVGASHIPRWRVKKDSDTETGINSAGASFAIEAYRDDGVSLGNAIEITRVSRIVNFPISPTVPTPPAGEAAVGAATLKVANTLWVATHFLKLSGGLLTGTLTLTPGAQGGDNDAATRGWVTEQLTGSGTGYLPKSGGLMTGDINMGNNFIYNAKSITIADGDASGHAIGLNHHSLNECGNVYMGPNGSISMGLNSGITFPTNATGNIILSGYARVVNSAPPTAVTDLWRQRDYVEERPLGNYNFSEYDTNAAVPEGWTGTGTLQITDGGSFGAYVMRLTNGEYLEKKFHPVDTDLYYECSARVSTSVDTVFVKMGVRCYDVNKIELSGSPRCPIGGTAGWDTFPSTFVNIGGVMRSEGSHVRWNFPPGTRYIKRYISVATSVGNTASVDHFTFRQLERGEDISGEMFGMRRSAGGTLNAYGIWNAYAFQAMCFYLMSHGGKAVLNAGTYDLGIEVYMNPQKLPSSGYEGVTINVPTKAFTIEGKGDATILRKSANHGDNILYWDNTTDITLRSFKIDGNNDAWPPAGSAPFPGASGMGTGYDWGHGIAISSNNVAPSSYTPLGSITLEGITMKYGGIGTMIYIVGSDPASGGYHLHDVNVINCYLDGMDSAGNGVLIGWAQDSRISGTTAYRVRSKKFEPWERELEGVTAVYEFATPAMGLQFKHDSLRCSIDNCSAVLCRNGASFTGTLNSEGEGGEHWYSRITGLSVEIGDKGCFGASIDDSYGGTYTGITINGGKYKNPPTYPDLNQVVGFNVGGASIGNYIEVTLEWFDTTDQNDNDQQTGAVRPVQFTGTSHDNFMQISAISDCGVRPLAFEGSTTNNMVVVGTASLGLPPVTQASLSNNFAVDASSGTNYFRYLRDSAYTRITASTP